MVTNSNKFISSNIYNGDIFILLEETEQAKRYSRKVTYKNFKFH